VRKLTLVIVVLVFRFVGCTEFLLSSEKNNGLVISGRSMEFSHVLDSKVVFSTEATVSAVICQTALKQYPGKVNMDL